MGRGLSDQMIPFNSPPVLGTEMDLIAESLFQGHLSGDGPFSVKCQNWFKAEFGCAQALLTPSCTHALEMAALLLDITPGDEVIMPSYTFVSTANAFALRGATIVFVDIRPDTMNIDETLIEEAITPKTKAIVPVHYAGVSCEMDVICDIARTHNLAVIEDAAQGIMATYKGRPLGTIGDIGAISFHETKNTTSGGEGGLIILNDERHALRAEIIREKGTNRSQFFRGQVDKYNWVDIGSSYLLNDISAAYLWAQIEGRDKIFAKRMSIYNTYRAELADLIASSQIEIQHLPQETSHNAHMFYLKLRDMEQRSQFIAFLRENKITAPFHYVPLHSSEAGKNFGRFNGMDRYTTAESERLVRLPIFYNMTEGQQVKVIEMVKKFFSG